MEYMDSTTITSNKIELIQSAIQQLLDSRKSENSSIIDDDDRNLLTKLLSRLESLKGDIKSPTETHSESNKVPSSTKIGHEDEEDDKGEEEEEEEVVKELKKLGRQNKITHWLLSGLMILTVAWQLSEVTILLKLKDGVSHPFRSLGRVVARVLKAPISDALESEIPSSSSTKQNRSNSHLDPNMGVSGLMTNSQE